MRRKHYRVALRIALERKKWRMSSPDLKNVFIDPNKQTYCLCNQTSYGKMVACDNDLCPIEWFHFECVKLTRIPKGKWYCPICRGSKSKHMKRKVQNVLTTVGEMTFSDMEVSMGEDFTHFEFQELTTNQPSRKESGDPKSIDNTEEKELTSEEEDDPHYNSKGEYIELLETGCLKKIKLK